MIISSLIKAGSVVNLCITDLFAQGAFHLQLFSCSIFQLRNSYPFEALKFSTRFASARLFVAWLKSEKADLTIETAGFNYQELDI